MVTEARMITPLQPRSGLPDGYPFDYERELCLSDGRIVNVRPVVPGDAVLLAREFELTDSDTIYQRFFNPAIKLDEKRLRYLTELDYDHRFAVAAFARGNGVAIARFELSGEGTAEIAVVVKEGWRGVGLATMLFELLEEAAMERGINQFEALYLPENLAIARVLAKRGFSGVTIDSGIARVTKGLRELPAGSHVGDPI
jgi:RimJ/RimL family protein N-acetyltransferase